jgi:myo-inositol-1(or 4)-monophosphatase
MIYTAISAAKAAGELLRRAFTQPIQVNQNLAHDIKIQTDVDSQKLITSMILEDYPDHKILGEEGDAGNPNGEIEWIVDPIDGTVNFVMGIPHFCISIAARHNVTHEMLLGVIYDPMRDELFTAEAGKPTLLNGKKQSVSKRNEIKEAMLAIGFAKSKDSIEHCLELYQYYGREAKKLRAMGSAALDLAYVAVGRLDAYIEQGVSLWDIAAGDLLVRQAGGKMEITPKAEGKLKIVASSGNLTFPKL